MNALYRELDESLPPMPQSPGDGAKDMINHPPHYESGKYECIDVMEEVFGVTAVRSFCLCNAFKYLYRCMSKHESPDEDIKKAIWYLERFIGKENTNDTE